MLSCLRGTALNLNIVARGYGVPSSSKEIKHISSQFLFILKTKNKARTICKLCW